jgi:dihydroxycyclohexadiene carboxylate dehydrogenase
MIMIHPGRFDEKVAVVTGAAQGIGHAVATGLAKEGARVALVDRSELVHEVSAKLAAEGAQAVGLTGDLERYVDCSTVMARAHEQFGRIDILVNNVGGTIWAKPYAHYDEDEIEAEIRRSLFPTLWCCRAVLPYMLRQQSGTIVNVSSVATRSVNRVPYAAAKGGVNAITASLAFEYASQGIRVVATAPGGTEAPERRVPRGPTEKTEEEEAWYQEIVDQTVTSSLLKRYGTLEEQAAPILFLASDEASYITGVTVPVAGGDLG